MSTIHCSLSRIVICFMSLLVTHTTSMSQETTATPVVISHRGASGYLPEHTQEAAVLAHAMGADYIEQDVVLTRDAVPVVLHDLTLDDVTNVAEVFTGRARNDQRHYVMDFTWNELQTLRVHERTSANRAWKDHNNRFPADQGKFRIATLSEHLALIRGLNQTTGRDTGIYVEIKDPARHREKGLDSSTVILKVLNDAGYRKSDDRIFVQCFDPSEIRRLREELHCELPLIQLCSKKPTPEQIAEYAPFVNGLGVQLTHVIEGKREDGTPIVSDVVQEARKHAIQVHVWTFRVDAMPEFCSETSELLSWLCRDGGIDGIFTDHPDVVIKWRNQNTELVGRSGPFHLLNESARPK
ncbi:MAG: glycerophosphodiester phosphodiesterase [Planctomyces sp.]|nr:glycerophosphodiester phosphodiesterase [Planctomyces sp.]